MNVFRFFGDMSHLFSIIVLLLRLRVAKNAQGKQQNDTRFVTVSQNDIFSQESIE
jgi:hypothetical protein